MKAGDKFVVELEYSRDVNGFGAEYNVVGTYEYARFWNEGVIQAAESYAAKQPAPAPLAPDGWEPKNGERVLVEVEYIGNPDEDGDVWIRVSYQYKGSKQTELQIISPSAIIGPAPAAPRFKVGDEVLHIPSKTVQIIERFEDGNYYSKKDRQGWYCFGNESEWMTIEEAFTAEARAKLA
jgi:hypothetical protein